MAAAWAVAGAFANGVVGVVLTVFWLSLITNAHNMIDGLDGLCGSVVAVESGALALLLLLCGDTLGMLLALGVLGCCLGYLPYNIHPARLFMGDEGALFLGFLVGWLTLRAYAAYDAPLLLPLLCLLPLTDLSFAVVRRLLQGQNPFRADRGHLHHRLCDSGFSQRKTVAMLLVISISGALLALIAVI
jgi:UDP-GlcNAc:undecaprenyl-phosphate GlcNAc-1-phosphate transferase